ncbi:MAG TPA: hypothetical protein VLH38_05020 [Patescibacteria group bacterium]|nr:hypothetical protein [Patescibacteria group bacterium]
MAKFLPPAWRFRLSQRVPLLFVIVSFAIIGGYFTWSLHAATPATSIEPEDGTSIPIGSVQTISSSQASGGKFVRFEGTSLNGFVVVCGMQLCLNGKSFIIHGATTYAQLDDPTKEVALAKSVGINTLELVNFDKNDQDPNSITAEDTWTRLDAFIAETKAQGLHIVLNLSGYNHALKKASKNPTTTDWQPFLQSIADRTNTKTGVKYKDDPTIAMIELVGEIDAPNYDGNAAKWGTTAQTTEFFKRSLAQLKALDGNHVISTGGFSNINDPGSGIDWRTIVADPNNAVCDVEINSGPDRNISVPAMSSYCNGISKPWFLAAWSSCQGPKDPSFEDVDNWDTDALMAAHAQDMYNIARNKNPTAPGPAMAAIGSDFWNLADTPYHQGNCDLGPRLPLSFAVVKTNAP